MSFDEVLYGSGQKPLNEGPPSPFKGLDIWILGGNQGGTVFRDEDVKEADLPLWLEEKGGFRRPEAVLHKDVKASFRLLYQQWPSEHDIADSDCLPMAKNTMTLIMRGLCLPRSYFYDFASKKSIPLRARPSFTERTISLSWQSPPLRHAFMSMAITYSCLDNKTCCYLGFQSNASITGIPSAQPRPGNRLLSPLHMSSVQSKAYDPMLLPTLAAGLWLEWLRDENYQRKAMLREIQQEIGLMDDYLQPSRRPIQQRMEFDAVHRKIVTQHGFLTNGMSEFIADLFPSTKNATQTIRHLRYSQQQQQSQHAQQTMPALQDTSELEHYISHMHCRARVELQHRDRMLSRMNVYLQVLYNLMQQQVAREAKKDSSAMKSISLLTTLFLPTTAIANIIGPFVKLDIDEGKFVMAPQFRLFWAVSAPVTILTLVIWIIWLQRAEIAGWIERSWNWLQEKETVHSPEAMWNSPVFRV